MRSYLAVKNLTTHPAITVCGVDDVIFSDIPKGTYAGFKAVEPGSVRLEIFDNFMKRITVLWVPIESNMRAAVTVRDEFVEFTPMPACEGC